MEVLTAGIDVGHQSVKVVVLGPDGIVRQANFILSGGVDGAARAGLERALVGVDLRPESLARIFVTGAGRESVRFAHGHPTEMLSHVRGAHRLFPGARSVIDMGAEGVRVLRCSAQGNLTSFLLNDKCASGTGVFLETVAGMMGIPVSEMGPISLRATGNLSLTSTCAVFAESEIVALVHRGAAREDILRGVHESIASRVTAISKRVGMEPELVVTGGVARNVGVVDGLRRQLGMEILVPKDPDMVGALGAAILAADVFGANRSAFGE